MRPSSWAWREARLGEEARRERDAGRISGEDLSSSSIGDVERTAGAMVAVEVSREVSAEISSTASGEEVGSEGSGASRVSGNSFSKR